MTDPPVPDASSDPSAAPPAEEPTDGLVETPTDEAAEAEKPAEASAEIREEERQEIRLALVMTGGVSLAVWMGGVTAELDRLARSVAPYGQLLDLVQATVRIDVIGGTSAGGVNGGLLAMGLTHRAELSSLRAAWLEIGSLRSMLRSPEEAHPPSLLRGDDYFLAHLRDVIATMDAGAPTDPAEDPMHLIMTTTLLRGQRRSFQDDYGGRIHDLSHRGTFSFVRGDEWGRDDFAEPGIVERLALAARSTASFPGAFEPSFAPIGSVGVDERHPDMAAHADFADGGFVIDGGVLSNKPIHQVLDVLFNRQTEGQGRRVLAYVIPDPKLPQPARDEDEDDRPDHIPPMARAIASSMQIPRVESVVSDLEAIRTHNRQVVAQRRLRESLLRSGGVDPADLAAQVFPAYIGTRREYRVRWVLELMIRGMRRPVDGGSTAAAGAIRSWDRSAVGDALSAALERHLPSEFPPAGGQLTDWPWDIAGVKGVVGTASQLLRMSLQVASATPESTPSASTEDGASGVRREAVLERLRQLREVRASLQRLRHDEERYWIGDRVRRLREVLASGRPGREERLAEWAAASFAACPTVKRAPELTGMANRIAGIMSPADPIERSLRWVLAVVVVQSAFSGSEPVVEQIVELLQISAETPNAFDKRDTGREKLAGLQLGHFGAFYKRSWRANDWMWGRMDAVPSVLRVALEPGRLLRLASADPTFAERFERGIRALALGEPGDPAFDVLQEPWDEGRFAWELTFLRDRSVPVPRALTWCIGAIERRIQLEILQEELPRVAGAVRHDLLDGAADRPEAREFVRVVHEAQQPPAASRPAVPAKGSKRQRGRHAQDPEAAGRRRRRGRPGPVPEVEEEAPLRPDATLPAFQACVVGREMIAEEMDSPLYHELMNAAAAVGLRAAHRHVAETNEALGHEPPPRATLPVVLPLVRSVAANSRGTFATMLVLMAAGAGMLGYGVWAGGIRWGWAGTGVGLLVLGLAAAWLRTRWPVLLLLVAAVAAGLLSASFIVDEGLIARGSFRAGVIGVFALAVVLLGYRSRRARRPRRATAH